MKQEAVELDDIRDGMNVLERMIKRAFDVICALIGLVVLSPVFLIIYIVLRTQEKGACHIQAGADWIRRETV